ncbi:hypothetical protein H1R20_g10071, partial [Candolleomyces eurysporus]
MLSVQYDLAQEEEESVKAGTSSAVHKDVTPSEFILQGLGIEDRIQRHLLGLKGLGLHATKLKKSESLEDGTHVRQKFVSWEELQRLYMPTVMPLRQSTGQEGKAASQNLQDIRLFLPSEIVPSVPCSEKLTRYEFKYRIAQAYIALRDLRERLIVRQHMFNSKKRYSHGTAAITRSNKKIELEGMRINELAGRYRSIREKLVTLSKIVGDWLWETTLKVLDDQDIRGLTMEDRRHLATDKLGKKRKLGEGRRRLTWIWFVSAPCQMKADKERDRGKMQVLERTEVDSDGKEQSEAGDEETSEGEESEEDENDAALQIEFCTTRARAHQWQEECMLLAEELRRVERFWAWDAEQWRKREADYARQMVSPAVELPPEELRHPELVDRAMEDFRILCMGRVAYARQQVSIRERLLEASQRQHAMVHDQLAAMKILGEDLDWRVMVECMGPQAGVLEQATANTAEETGA